MRPKLTIGSLLTSKGRLSRSGFWTFLFAMMGLFVVLSLVMELFKSEKVEIAVGLLVLPVLLMALFAQIKRWHDLDRSGWWCLINPIPLLNLYAFIMCGFVKGTNGSNRFGVDPLAAPPSRPQPPSAPPPRPATPPQRFIVPSAVAAPAAPTHIKVACGLCNGHIEFPVGMAGQIIDCPHCHQRITLPT
jgi:uncharacterized membrane protein YhaH (DUF805 family)